MICTKAFMYSQAITGKDNGAYIYYGTRVSMGSYPVPFISLFAYPYVYASGQGVGSSTWPDVVKDVTLTNFGTVNLYAALAGAATVQLNAVAIGMWK